MRLRVARVAVPVMGGWLAFVAASGGCRSAEAVPAGSVAAAQAVAAEGGAAPAPAAADEPAEVPLVPLMGKAVLEARAHAQRSALGEGMPLFEDERGQPVPWIAPQVAIADEPAFDGDLLDSLQGSSGLGGTAADEGPRPNGNILGLFEPIEAGETAPLRHFHQALRALEHGDDRKVRVMLVGASHTEADIYPQYIRSYLQERFGDGGHGFVLPAAPWRGYGHVDVSVDGLQHWRTEHAQRRDARDDGRYGLLGASISSRSDRAYGRVIQHAGVLGSRYELWFVAQPRGGSVDVIADGRTIATVRTAARHVGPGYHAFELPESEHTIEVRVRGDGEVRLTGLVIERDDPGVVVDTLGIRGTRAANALAWDRALWSDNVRHRAPDLFVLAFGTNEATDVTQDIATYEANLREVVQRYRAAAPQASCVLVGPGDFPQASGGTLIPRPRLSQIIEVQSRVSTELGCGFWDMQAFMGGELSMVQWVRAAPAMAQPDYIHLSRRGYVRMGMALVDALMGELDGDDPLHGRTPPR
ncbi:MAG: hypothetical protein IPH07_22560 [Deltaproteobacteria bacterium]|nr:hypothetical protein [Deltaproteobacteria bacterium]MBP7285969.1 hypothetical protein [Nannocystaceae bacterium]